MAMPRKLTPPQEQLVRELHEAGSSLAVIARMLAEYHGVKSPTRSLVQRTLKRPQPQTP